MIFSYFFILLLCIGNCYTNEFLSESITHELNHTQINGIYDRENILSRFSRQNVANPVKSNPNVETKKSESIQEAPKSQKPPVEQKMKPRTNSHKNSHSASGRRANIAATLKQKLKPIVRTRPISKLYSNVKLLARKFSSKARSFDKSKLSGLRKNLPNAKQR